MDDNSPTPTRWQRLRKNRNDEYQLIVRDVKNFREVGQYNLTPVNLYVVGSVIFVVLLVLVFLLIAFTPLRSYIPGYGDVVELREMAEMEEMLGQMGERVESQSLYIENLRRTITGETTTEADVEDLSNLVDTTDVEIAAVSADEVQLRREMDLERLGNASRQLSSIGPTPGSSDVPLAQIFLLAPVSGEISAAFNPAAGHLGVDILAPRNTPIKACRDGVVFLSEFTSANGNVIGIQHDNNLLSFYKHTSQLLKKVGERVNSGEAVAIVGNTGELTSGPHLHFELWHEGAAVDPVNLLRF
ncbi:M23 family metallopeptidase [Neolewinella antarctica]|uniref:Murein DD-endopeptidase MepM/ murein hydrolase activator NlpD n=1 Tax=Neolewinella antarctica TaxID=442734 RepID=A0ABX0XF54_9BACT|nr:M23 family metallopeptidase [Neolewinella antarctica]NJC27953.1 murein DD-endopeptidase MepM/ murein hydrolase activator NlpD [Neolewinella antarctica]